MTVVHAWAGAPTSTGFRVVAKVTGSSTRLAVADNDTVSGATYFGPVTPSADGIAQLTATGLSPDTRYWWAVEDDGLLDTDARGQCVTHPTVGEPASYTIWMGGDAGAFPATPGEGSVLAADRLSNHTVFETIRAKAVAAGWLMGVHLGDLHYYDLGSDSHGIVGGASVANYQRAYDDVLAQTQQHALYRDVPLVYVWDDHDYGPDNSDRTSAGRGAAAQVYRERVPHYPLPAGVVDPAPIYQSWQIGRVLYVAADVRYDRDPNSTPAGPSKTMLGAAQVAWMETVLSTTTAEALVWITPSAWVHPTSIDNWEAGFADEQQYLVDMFDRLGWSDRMCIVWADRHALGIDSGTNVPGGAPGFQFAAFDCLPPSTPGDWFDQGESLQRGQYGTLTVEDTGDQITITGTGWVGATPWRIYSFTIQVTPPPPPPAGARQSVAVARDEVTWLGCDLVTGRILAELPEITGRISRILGDYTSSSLTLPIPVGGPAAQPISVIEAATEPRRTMLVAVINDVPTWGGIVLLRQGGDDATLRLGCVSIEGYLDRRHVGDHTWVGQDEAATIAAGLAGDATVEGIGLLIDAPPTGRLRDRTYTDQDDATVYSRLRELMAVTDGPEWTIDLDWTDATRTAVAKILRIRSRIGAVSDSPDVVFDTLGEGSARYIYTEDYTEARGANHIVATSSGEGELRPQSAPARDVPAGHARWERRWSPSSSITDQATLDAHAMAELALRRDGSRTVQITTRWTADPRLSIHWGLGDDVAWHLVGHRHPGGLAELGRVIGWELDIAAGLISPILWEGS